MASWSRLRSALDEALRSLSEQRYGLCDFGGDIADPQHWARQQALHEACRAG